MINFWVQASLWLAQIFYFACLVPQIITNHRQKSGKGVSDFLLIGYLNAYLFLLFYVFSMNMPTAYKIMVPLQTLATITLIVQRLYYDNSPLTKKYWYALGANLLAFIFFIPHALIYPVIIGMSFGWINFIISVLNQLPQILKIHQEKSVEGFSILFVIFTGTAAIIEISASLITYLPPQTRFNAVRAIVLCAIFCWQFRSYKKKMQVFRPASSKDFSKIFTTYALISDISSSSTISSSCISSSGNSANASC